MILKHAVFDVVIALVFLWHHEHPAQATLLEPASRGTLWKRGYHVPATLEENAIYCGGHQHQELTEYGANFGRGEVTKVFNAGGSAVFEVDQRNIKNDNAYIEFKICPSNNSLEHEPQECFDRHPVLLQDGSGYRFYLGKSEKAKVRVKIPNNVNCQFCVLQYHIHEGSGEKHLERLRNRELGSMKDFYGCSDIAIQRELGSHFNTHGIQGPLIDGVIVKGAANFGNIFGPGSYSSGASNAWSQSLQTSGSSSQSSQSGGSYRGPLIKGVIIEGTGNFGNIYGTKSVSTGSANAWSQGVASSQHGSSYGSQTQPAAFGQIISGPQIKGININAQSNFGNIFGPGSISTGNVNAWSQHITYGNSAQVENGGEGGGGVGGGDNGTNGTGGSGSAGGPNGDIFDINNVDTDIYLKCYDIVTTLTPPSSTTTPESTITTSATTTATTTTTSTTQTPTIETTTTPTIITTTTTITPTTTPLIPEIEINCTGNTGTTPNPPDVSTQSSTYYPPSTTQPPTPSKPSQPPFWIPPYGPSIYGISINGSSNFGNIFGQGSISTGNANAWSQKIVNSGTYLKNYGTFGPSIKGIRISGPGNFGNIFKKGSIATGTANAWSQHVLNTANGQVQRLPQRVIGEALDFNKFYGSGPLNTEGSSVVAQSVIHSLQSKPVGSAISALQVDRFRSHDNDFGGNKQYFGTTNMWPKNFQPGGTFSVSK